MGHRCGDDGNLGPTRARRGSPWATRPERFSTSTRPGRPILNESHAGSNGSGGRSPGEEPTELRPRMKRRSRRRGIRHGMAEEEDRASGARSRRYYCGGCARGRDGTRLRGSPRRDRWRVPIKILHRRFATPPRWWSVSVARRALLQDRPSQHRRRHRFGDDADGALFFVMSIGRRRSGAFDPARGRCRWSAPCWSPPSLPRAGGRARRGIIHRI